MVSIPHSQGQTMKKLKAQERKLKGKVSIPHSQGQTRKENSYEKHDAIKYQFLIVKVKHISLLLVLSYVNTT